ncbi:unknown [Roseburia sp. CAG:182]|nr:unknown [Roseburia sp. CAG:182]
MPVVDYSLSCFGIMFVNIYRYFNIIIGLDSQFLSLASSKPLLVYIEFPANIIDDPVSNNSPTFLESRNMRSGFNADSFTEITL